ncbi:MAG: heavy-metal-associated domain-containing protein [Nitrososphaerales archaeon]
MQSLWKPKAKSRDIFKIPEMTLTSQDIRSYDPIRRVVYVLEGVLEVNANYLKGEVIVESDPTMITVEEIDHAIRSLGYKTRGLTSLSLL